MAQTAWPRAANEGKQILTKRCDFIWPIKMDKNTIGRAFSAAMVKEHSVHHASYQRVLLTMAQPSGQPADQVSSPPAHTLPSLHASVFHPQAKKTNSLPAGSTPCIFGIFGSELAMSVSDTARRTQCWQGRDATQLLASEGGATGA